jgi:molecular chaperone GrpE
MSDSAETPPPAADAAVRQPDAAASDAAPSTPEDRVAALEAEVEQLRDRWLRAEAENQNQRARAERQVADARNYAIQKFARDVVEAAENLRRGLDALPPAAPGEDELLAKLRGGFEGVERSFLGLLERNGIARRDVQGESFDPEFHQAMAEQPAPDGVAPGTVLQAWTPAWTLNGRLLKPAMVVVAAAGGGAAAAQ